MVWKNVEGVKVFINKSINPKFEGHLMTRSFSNSTDIILFTTCAIHDLFAA